MIPELADRAAEHGRLAIDTEFVSERRYQAQLCLIQVAVPDDQGEDGVRTEVLDPIADQLDPGPLARVLADPAVEVIVHAGRQDVAILRRTWETEVTSVFDTQVAAGFLGFGNQEGYEQLVRRVLGVRLRGGEGFTRWDKRPLTDKQLAYAADDARCLLALGDALERELEERGRFDWAREESRLVEAVRRRALAQQAYERLPKLGRLDHKGRAVAHAPGRLARRDRARAGPPAAVGAARPGAGRAGQAHAEGPGRAGQHPRAAPADPAPARRRAGRADRARARARSHPRRRTQPPKRDSSEAPLVSLAQAVVRQRSRETGVATELIATQSELTALVRARSAGSATPTACARSPAGAASWSARSWSS